MSRYLMMAALLLSCVAALACQSFNAGYQKALTQGSEAAALSSLHKIAREQQTYRASSGRYGTFQQLVEAGFLDERYNSDKAKVNEYFFAMTVTQKGAGTQKDSFSINTDPAGPDPHGRHFFFDASGLIHVNASQPATANDPLLKDPVLDP